MARRTPPNYPVDSEPVYVPGTDNAWDEEKIKRELEGLDDDAPHPIREYFSGTSRYRLETVADYLDETKSPEKWYLRDPPPHIRRKVTALLARWRTGVVYGGDGEILSETPEAMEAWGVAWLTAARHGVKRVENPPCKIDRDREGALTDETVNALDRIDARLVESVGMCVQQAFRALDETEGKA